MIELDKSRIPEAGDRDGWIRLLTEGPYKVSLRKATNWVDKIRFAGVDDCWTWSGSHAGKNRSRPYVTVNHRPSKTGSNLAAVLAVSVCGRFLDGMCCCHYCDRPGCVNPHHLWLGTQQENMQDMRAKGRGISLCGEDHYVSRVTESEVMEIRELYDKKERSPQELADIFGLSRSAVNHIVKGRSWKHLLEKQQSVYYTP